MIVVYFDQRLGAAHSKRFNISLVMAVVLNVVNLLSFIKSFVFSSNPREHGRIPHTKFEPSVTLMCLSVHTSDKLSDRSLGQLYH